MITVEVRNNTDYILRQGIDGPQVELTGDEAMDLAKHILSRRQAAAEDQGDIVLLAAADGPEAIKVYLSPQESAADMADRNGPAMYVTLNHGLSTYVRVGPFMTTVRDQVMALLNR